MNKFLLLILSFNILNSAYGNWSANEFWDQENTPKLKITCDANENLCGQLCNKDNSCEVKEAVCRDCIGTSILMTNIFEEMGLRYRSTNELVSSYEFVDFLKSGKFVSFSSKSIYNQTDSYDSESLKAKFHSLCPVETQNTLVIFSIKNISKVLDEVKYVVCDSSIYRMSNNPEVVFNDDLKLNNKLKSLIFR